VDPRLSDTLSEFTTSIGKRRKGDYQTNIPGMPQRVGSAKDETTSLLLEWVAYPHARVLTGQMTRRVGVATCQQLFRKSSDTF